MHMVVGYIKSLQQCSGITYLLYVYEDYTLYSIDVLETTGKNIKA